MPRSFVLAFVTLLACNSPEAEVELAPPSDPTLDPDVAAQLRAGPTGSTTIVDSPRGDGVFAVDPLMDRVVFVPEAGVPTVFDVGDEPSRITHSDERLFVTLRGDGEVVSTTLDGTPLARVAVGLEPIGIVAERSRDRIYVAVSLSDTVLALDATTLEVLESWNVDEPRFLALDEAERTLFVTRLRGDAVDRIDLENGSIEQWHAPTRSRLVDEAWVALESRVSGDPWVVPQTGELLVPMLYVDTATPVAPSDPDVPTPPTVDVYTNEAQNDAVVVGKLSPAIVRFAADGTGEAFWAGGLLGRSYVSSVTSTHDGSTWIATMEASNAVIYLDPSSPVDNRANDTGLVPERSSPRESGFSHVAASLVDTAAGPVGAVLTERGVRVHSDIDRAVSDGRIALAATELAINADAAFNPPRRIGAIGRVALPGDPGLDLMVELGRQLFYSAMPGVVGGGGVSCSTCHVDGRTDGLTWAFADGVRQTPSLAGVVSETEPVTWIGAVATVSDEAFRTSAERMGGPGLLPTEANAVAEFVDWTRAARRPAPSSASGRGEALFQQLGCLACHNGARYTDNVGHTLRGEVVNTPSLNGVGATAPYLRDGSAPDLASALDAAYNGGMANTSGLTPAELSDLVAFLETL
ncbi:MAG: c-type cytochrome [Alphaproteobacteria bacterium]|nr:c-type cytochrome [Alphaproteobacteria bacterium]